MRGNGCSNLVKLSDWKSPAGEKRPRVLDGVGNVIPARKLEWIIGAVSDKDAEVVHPCGGEDYVVVIGKAFADAHGERVKARLVAELILRLRFSADKVFYGFTPVCRHGEPLRLSGHSIRSNRDPLRGVRQNSFFNLADIRCCQKCRKDNVQYSDTLFLFRGPCFIVLIPSMRKINIRSKRTWSSRSIAR